MSAEDQTLRVTPAMELGLAGHVWKMEEIIDLANETTLKATV
jgi:hypothetical protein